jgi:signal peptidase I
MAPAIPLGTLIFMTPAGPDQLRVGDVITFPRPGHPEELITHRIAAIDQGSIGPVFQTKGDANAQPDGWRLSLQGRGWRYAFGLGVLGFVVAGAQSSTGRLVAIIIPSLLLGLLVLVQIWRRRPFPVPAA